MNNNDHCPPPGLALAQVHRDPLPRVVKLECLSRRCLAELLEILRRL